MAIRSIKSNTNVTSEIEEQVNAKQASKKKKGALNKEISFGKKVSVLDISLAMRHVSIMLKSGMSLAETIAVMSEQSVNPHLQEVFYKIYVEVQKGNSMATAMKEHPKVFDKITISIIDVGEQGGTLERNLLFLADFLKQNHELNSKVKGALMYPLIVFFITIAEMMGVLLFIMPTLEDLFKSFDNVPAMTKAVMALSSWMLANIVIVIIGTIGFVVVVWRVLKTKKGMQAMDVIKIRFPIIKNLNIYHILTNFSRTLGILLESGIPIVTALRITKDTIGNIEYAKLMNTVYEAVEAGGSLSESLAKYPQFFPGTYVKMIQVGEETGSLEENLMYLFDFYQGQVKDMSNNLASLLEPILLIFIGVMIAALAIMIILPIYQLTGSITG